MNTARCVIFMGVVILVTQQGLPVDSYGDSHLDGVLANITVRQGETVFLRCPQDDEKTLSAWLNRTNLLYTGETKWTTDRRVSLELLSRSEFVIRIDDVGIQEDGQYVCVSQTPRGMRKTVVYVIVQVPPKITFLTEDMALMEGSDVSLMCSASGNPEPTISWKRVSPTAYSLVSEDGYLEIKDISRHRAGTYECSAINDVSTDAKTIELKVNYPPTLMEVKDVGVPVGQQAVLGCEAEAEPAANFEWYKDNERVMSGSYNSEVESQGKLSKLIFFNVSEANYGNYSCVAKNNLGIANASMVLYVSLAGLMSVQERSGGTMMEYSLTSLLVIVLAQVLLKF
uniref:Neurotrimin n=1 Tax=Paramormyrops kingsleyae TaxID=1676925 RepID=A0A3B3RKR3_9TELE